MPGLSARGGQDLVLSTDYHSPRGEVPTPNATHSSLNFGAFLVRSNGPSAWAPAFFAHLYNGFPELVDHVWWEQAALLTCSRETPEGCQGMLRHSRILSWDAFNSHRYGFRRGDFAAHWAGIAREANTLDRLGAMANDVKDFLSAQRRQAGNGTWEARALDLTLSPEAFQDWERETMRHGCDDQHVWAWQMITIDRGPTPHPEGAQGIKSRLYARGDGMVCEL